MKKQSLHHTPQMITKCALLIINASSASIIRADGTHCKRHGNNRKNLLRDYCMGR